MKFIKSLGLSVLGSFLFLSPSLATGTYEEHVELYNTLVESGVPVHINDTQICTDGMAGAYYPQYNVMGICQDNRSPITETQVKWTENDLDTLRHEAQHVVQDCVAGLDNSDLQTMFNQDTDEYSDFIIDNLTDDEIQSIIQNYRSAGADDETIILELEAFAVAKSVNPLLIASAVKRLCNN